MKLKLFITLGLLTSSTLFAQTTMCFKENHTSMATIESTPLDGGECNSSKSIKDMKNEGWSVDDIKIESSSNGTNYIYILKKDSSSISSVDEAKIEERIMQKLETRKEQETLAKKVEIKYRMSEDGKEIYVSTCQQCHGEKAEKKAYNTSRPLIDLNLSDFQQAIRDYTLGEYDRGMSMVMTPYANNLNTKRVKDVYSYILTLKPKKEEESK